jgi:oligopeptidase A
MLLTLSSMPTSPNPLLLDYDRIPFGEIEAAHVVPAVKDILEDGRAEIEALVSVESTPTYADTIGRLDDALERVKERTVPITHLLSVAETPELREAYGKVLPEITEFWTRVTLNEGLWSRIRALAETDEAAALSPMERRHLDTTLRDFRRAGADLSTTDKEKLSAIRLEISSLEQKFPENVIDATNAYSLLIEDGGRLEGVPDADREEASRKAAEKGQEGWLLTLDYPSFEPIIKHAHDRDLRRELYTAYVERCRDGEFDNRDIIARLLHLRRELAEVLGYADFADYRLVDHMAKTGEQAFGFVEDMTQKTRLYWERDLAELREHASVLGLSEIEPWDTAFLAESLRRDKFDIDDEVIRPYFPLDRVLDGMFEVVRRVFGLVVTEQTIPEVWNPDVHCYELSREEDGTLLGFFYADWHPRPDKRQGAWMNALRTGGPRDGGFEPHVGMIAGNLSPPKGDVPSLLTHREVQTIFHEFGHLLHHLTSTVPIAPMAGINVAWDFVEFPSQIMENWTWEEEAISLFSGHHESGEPLPKELYERLRRARTFLGGWMQMRQLSFGHLDLRLHRSHPDAVTQDLMSYIEGLFEEYTPGPAFARMHVTTSFTHLFAGGYAAAYYSYLWSEVLDADAFGRFRLEGIFNREVGDAYLASILTRGDSDEPEALFREFMGRDPDLQPLLERNLGRSLDDGSRDGSSAMASP